MTDASRDPVQLFMAALQDAGLIVRDINTSGELTRVKTLDDKSRQRTGWYVYHNHPEFSCGVFGDWRSGVTRNWSSRAVEKLDPVELERYRAQMETLRANHQRQKAAAQQKAAVLAADIWRQSDAAAVDQHAYVQRKQIKPIGARRYKSNLVVPVYNWHGDLQSLQFVHSNGSKYFLPDGKIRGGFCKIGRRSKTIFICEGYSTGCSVHMATDQQVYCCLNKSNMLTIAERLRSENIGSNIVIAGDDDQFLPKRIGNVGRVKATEAGERIHAPVKFPAFNDLASEPTDFNDLHILEGIEAVKAQLVERAPPLSFSLSTIADRADKEIQWVLDGVLSRGAPAILFAPGGAGKGYFIQQLTTCVSTGAPFFGTPVLKGPCLSVYCEDDIEELHRRQRAICEQYRINYSALKDVHIVSRVTEPNSFLITFDNRNIGKPTDFFHQLEAEIARIKPVLVTFDTSGDGYPGNENDKSQVNQFLKGMIGALSSRHNCSFLLTGHTAKSRQSQFAGHMAWENSVRHRLFIDHNRNSGIRCVHLSKSNRAKEQELYKLIWRDGCLVQTDGTGTSLEDVIELERDCLYLLGELFRRKINVNMNKSRAHAPKILLKIGKEKNLDWTFDEYLTTVERLLENGVIELIDGHNRGKAQTLNVIDKTESLPIIEESNNEF